VGVAAATGSAWAGAWVPFQFGDVGSMTDIAVVIAADEPQVDVTDAFLSGDQFHVEFLTTSVAGDTSLPTSVGDTISDDYDGAFADSRWSSGSFLVGPGSFTMRITVIQSPFGAGGAAYRTAVPAPGAVSLLALGGLALVRRRR